MGFLLMMVVLFALMWFLLIRPQQKRTRQQQLLLASLTAGQEVATAGGLFGTITDVDIEEVVLEIADGVNVRVDKRAIVSVVEEEEVEEEPSAEPLDAGDADGAAAPVEAEQR